MKHYGHGLVLGAFCPPHAGHHHLVRTARESCERLTVLVLAGAGDPLPLADRVDWMREIHPDALVIGTDGSPRDAVSERVDAVFTSETCPETCPETYGGGLARRFGAESVRVDPDRTHLPVSDAAVRKDPAGHWDLLEPPVRAALTRRVAVLGAESTGATTMALALTDHYRRRGGVWARTRCVPDLTVTVRADAPYRSGDFPVVAQRQAESEEEAARAGSPVLFCDGDAFATAIRHERHLGTASPDTCQIAARSRQHLWLLTDHRGVPLKDTEPRDVRDVRDGRDGRDGREEEQLRSWTTARLLTQLTHTGRPTAVLTGPHEERLATAVAAVDALLAHPLDLLPERR